MRFPFRPLTALALLCAAGCVPDSPYRAADAGRNIWYSTFNEPPKSLDPSVTYTSDAYVILQLLVEPPLRYHYLKRPYELDPATLTGVPRAVTRGTVTTYDLTLKPGIRYQPHPCFAPGPLPTEADLSGITDLMQMPGRGTRELTASDYELAIRRLADPTLRPNCPILPLMAKYIDGLGAFAALLRKDLDAERARRRKAGGALYDAEADERRQPIVLDLMKHPLPGAKVLNPRTLRLTIRGRYPQILYWLAMPFFAPVPAEALRFYGHGPIRARNLTIQRYPVGTGPFRIETYNPNREIVLLKNEHWRGEPYPTTGEPGDKAAGLLADAGKAVPFLDGIVLKLEKEAIPRWIKFTQGWYDGSGVPTESFDQVVNFSEAGDPALSKDGSERGWRLETEVELATYYYAFNMTDDVLGGYTEAKRKLRRAIAIAIDTEERIQIFYNGLGRAAQGFIPPGIFGFEDGKAGVDPYVYEWDTKASAPKRRPLAEAKKLLAEAGYAGGRGRDGKPLEIRFATAATSAEQMAAIRWLSQKFDALGIKLKVESSDYNRFQEKVHQGNFQMLSWGWHADYPDPENFLFLLYGPNGQMKHDGENHSNYDSPEFNRLFEKLETMENGPARLALIRQATEVARRDAPLVWGWHPMTVGLYHGWVANTKPHALGYGNHRFWRLDAESRAKLRKDWNRPVIWPVVLGLLLLVAVAWPAVAAVKRRLEHPG